MDFGMLASRVVVGLLAGWVGSADMEDTSEGAPGLRGDPEGDNSVSEPRKVPDDRQSAISCARLPAAAAAAAPV